MARASNGIWFLAKMPFADGTPKMFTFAFTVVDDSTPNFEYSVAWGDTTSYTVTGQTMLPSKDPCCYYKTIYIWHVYSSVGTYMMVINIWDSLGRTDSSHTNVSIANPAIVAGPMSSCTCPRV